MSIGKLEMQIPLGKLKSLIEDNGIAVLPITFEQAILVGQLPFYHKDPFDRLLIAQAIVGNMPLLSRDEKCSLYDVKVVW